MRDQVIAVCMHETRTAHTCASSWCDEVAAHLEKKLVYQHAWGTQCWLLTCHHPTAL